MHNTANTKYTVAEPSVVACFVLLIIKGCEEYCSSLILKTFQGQREKNILQRIMRKSTSFALWSTLFICLCGVLRHTREFFTHNRSSPLPVKAMSSEGSLACHTGYPFIMVISDDIHTYCSGAFFFRLNDLRLSRLRFKHPTLRLLDKRSYWLRYHGSWSTLLSWIEW